MTNQSGVTFKYNGPSGFLGKSFLSLFFLVFLGFGLGFAWMVLRDGLAALSTWSWKETPCEIIVSEIREMGDDGRRTDNFRVYIKYQYTFGERSFVSENVRRKLQSFSDYGKASQLIGRFPAETKAVCYVKSTEPSRAVLLRDNPAFLLTIFFPLIFVVIGAGGIYFVWRPTRIAQEQSQPISERANKRTSQAFSRVFFSVFLLVGLGFLYAFFLRPMFWIIAAKQWPAVTCTIISSNLRSHSSSDGTTYSVNIFYTYEFHGQEYKANRYSFMGGSSSGYRGKQHIVEQYPPGKSAVCYVNPNDPTQAVLVPGFTPAMWFGLIPLVFVFVGVWGLRFGNRTTNQTGIPNRGVASNMLSGWSPALHSPGTHREVLKPKISPIGKVLGSLFICLFWNGIVSVFLVHLYKDWHSGIMDWFLAVFLTPFVLIGLVIFGAVIYTFLGLFNPQMHLTVTPSAVPLGETLRMEWELNGRIEVLQNLTLRLEGREEATYRRGTDNCTDTNVFARIEIANVTANQGMRSGNGTITIPADSMHSFTSTHNKIIWTIRAEGEIPRWPDLSEEFALTVLPSRLRRQQDI